MTWNLLNPVSKITEVSLAELRINQIYFQQSRRHRSSTIFYLDHLQLYFQPANLWISYWHLVYFKKVVFYHYLMPPVLQAFQSLDPLCPLTETQMKYRFCFFFLCFYLTISSVQSLSCVRLLATPWIVAHQASLSITNSPEFTQTHVYLVGDAIQPSYPLSSPSPPAPNPCQHQSLFQWVNSLHEVAKVLEFQL